MKLKNLKYKALAVLVVLAVGMGFVRLTNTRSAYAEKIETRMFVSPMTQRIILVPGETYTGTVTVSNTGSNDSSVNFEAKVGSYVTTGTQDSKDDYGGATVDEKTSNNIMMDWVTLDKTEGTVASNTHEPITFTIKVPKDAPAGAQYASILISEKNIDSSTSKNNGTSGVIQDKYQIASAIFANVAGETVEKGSISENDLPSILTNSKLEATSMVRNEGNIYTDATYTLQVWPLFNDEELCTNEEKAETSMILPNTERYHVQTCDLPAVGIFRAKQVVSIFGEESVLEKTIIVCPIWLMILVLIIIIAIIVAVVIVIGKNKANKSED